MTDKPTGRDVLVTGPSRSGTTLTCELLNKVADVVALDEPMNALSMLGHEVAAPSGAERRILGVRRVASRVRHPGTARPAPPPSFPPDPGVACDNIERFLAETRASITGRGVALSRNVGGRVLGRKVADEHDDQGRRLRLAEHGEISVDKQLSDAFVLAIKQTSGFIALLGPLARRFEVYAVVRNPLAVIMSWQTLPFHPGDGHVRLGEGIDWDLRDRLAAMADRTDRQFEILAWYFGRIRDCVGEGHVIRYEELVGSGGRALSVIDQRAAALRADLENRNARQGARDGHGLRVLGERLLATPGPWWHFYSEDSVRGLLVPGR